MHGVHIHALTFCNRAIAYQAPPTPSTGFPSTAPHLCPAAAAASVLACFSPARAFLPSTFSWKGAVFNLLSSLGRWPHEAERDKAVSTRTIERLRLSSPPLLEVMSGALPQGAGRALHWLWCVRKRATPQSPRVPCAAFWEDGADGDGARRRPCGAGTGSRRRTLTEGSAGATPWMLVTERRARPVEPTVFPV